MKKFLRFLFYSSAIVIVLGNSTSAMEIDNPNEFSEITQEILKTYQLINNNWCYPLNSSIPVETTKSWKELTVQTDTGNTSTVVWDFEGQPSFSKALSEIISAKLVMECSNAAKIARLALISSVIKDQGMLKLISTLKIKHSKSEFNLMSDLTWQFFKQASSDNKTQFYAYPFVNIPEYTHYKNGPDGNHNIIKLPNNSYIGFAPDFFSAGRTYEELSAYLFNKFNDPSDTKVEKLDEHAIFCQNQDYNLFEEERKEYQSQVGYFFFDLEAAKKFATQK